MERSKGIRSKTRGKMKKKPRQRGLPSLSRILQEFDEGQFVHIDIEPSIHKGMPHPKFQGKTAVVKEKRGSSYVLEIKEGSKRKTIIARPEHLRPQRG
ncbi:MAG: 50S ribosomal protein L21e [Theionarchaea archaeon]|nr:MAG: 50S ribosomal protein L21 [Theionarchaea archaeon DG-70-1]MBU7027390.1 50S ribosomal protein L21e [Theionarchaea archaeon]